MTVYAIGIQTKQLMMMHIKDNLNSVRRTDPNIGRFLIRTIHGSSGRFLMSAVLYKWQLNSVYN